MNERILFDTSVLVAAVFSAREGARQLLKLGEAGVTALWVGPALPFPLGTPGDCLARLRARW